MNQHIIEELFRGSRKTLRVLRVLMQAEAPLTKYAIESRAAVYDASAVLANLERINVVKSTEGRPKRYVLNRENPIVVAAEKFMKEIGYIP